MIVLKSPEEIEKLRASNAIVVEVMAILEAMIVPGVTTIELDRRAEEHIRKQGATPSFLGYLGYQHTLCTSINEEVVHGIPSDRALQDGDIVSIDCGVLRDGYHGDHARTFFVGETPSEELATFLRVSEESLLRGIEKMQLGNRLFDISAAIQEHAETNGYGVVRDYVGHGIGQNLHEEPQVPNFGCAGTGMKLLPGLVLAIEPMLNQGSADVRLLEDGWTVVTKDHAWSTHFEHSVALTDDGPQILSKA